MNQTIQALGGILLKAIPTIVLVLLVHIYLKKVLFQPLARILKQRDEATAGAREAAEASLARAEQRAAEYDAALRDARAAIYKDQEQSRTTLAAEQDARLREAKTRVDGLIADAKSRILAEADTAKHGLTEQAQVLAEEISSTVLKRAS